MKIKTGILLFLFVIITTDLSYGVLKITQCKSDIANLEVALDIYEIENKYYPSTEDWEEELISNRIVRDETACIDPWGNKYIYIYPSIYNTYGFDIYSMGRDGHSETGGGDKDDVNNWDTDNT